MHHLARDLSSCSRREATHPKTRDFSQCPSEETVVPVPRDMSYGSGGQAQCPPGGLTHIFAKVQEPSCSHNQKQHCQGRRLPIGDPALACTEQRAHSLPGNMSKLLPPGHLATSLVEDQEPHSSGLRCQEEGHVTGDSVLSYPGHLTRDPVTLYAKLHYKPFSEEPLDLRTEDHRQPCENNCCNKLTSCSSIGHDHVPSSLTSPSHVELRSSGCIQATPQSPKVEGNLLVPCEPLHINQLPPSLLLKVRNDG